jgi:hypothetical protein
MSSSIRSQNKQFSAAEWTDVMHAFEKHFIFQALTDGAGVIFDPHRELVGREIWYSWQISLIFVGFE